MTETFNEPFPLAYGTYDDAVKMLNKPGEKVLAEFSVNWEMIKIYCSMVEDGNASYWDEDYANKQWGGIVAPPGLLLTWPMSLQWHPNKERKHYFIAMTIPLPGDTIINVATNTEFHRHLYLGDRVSVVDELTRLGIGHFLTTKAQFFNQRDQLIAVQTNSLFRYYVPEDAS